MTSMRRRAAKLAVVTLALTTAMVGAMTSASAAPDNLPDAATYDGHSSLTITKLEAPNVSGAKSDGTQEDASVVNQSTPLPDVTFKITPINGIDLTTNQGWQDASTLADSFATAALQGNAAAEAFFVAPYTLDTASAASLTTDASGIAAFDSLPFALYLVEETGAPAGVTPAAPFVVSVPMTDPGDTSKWMYDIYCYPKNSITKVTKTVDDATATSVDDPNGTATGNNTVTWTITGDIPADDGTGSPVSGYKITDTLAAQLTYVSTAVYTLDLQTPPAAPVATLVDPSYYTITTTGGSGAATNWTLLFNSPPDADGLGLLTDARDNASIGAQVQVVITTKVTDVGELGGEVPASPDPMDDTSGSIVNYALVYPNQYAIEGKVDPAQSNDVDTKWGTVTLVKFDKIGTDGNPVSGPDDTYTKRLAGAVFSVYTSEQDAKDDTNAVQTGLTTDSNGMLTVSGLRYSYYADGEQLAAGDNGVIHYWLAETQAPSGYELLAQPITFDVLQNQDPATATWELQVPNVKHNGGFPLPFTGGTGVTLIYAAGLIVIVTAIGLGIMTSRRRRYYYDADYYYSGGEY